MSTPRILASAGNAAPNASVPRARPVGVPAAASANHARPAAQAPAVPPRAPALPLDGIELGDPYIAADDERLYREFSVTNRKYFPFEGGYEEKKTIVTTRTYLDNPADGET